MPLLLWRYLLALVLGPVLLASLLLSGLTFVLQALRLGHHVLGPGADLQILGALYLNSLPTLVVFSLPYALAGAVSFAMLRLASSGQLLALRVAGASPLQVALPCLVASFLAALTALGTAELVEPAALARLARILGRGATRVLIQGTTPGRFHSLGQGATLYAERRLPGPPGEVRLGGLFLAIPPRVVVARQARIRSARTGLALVLELDDGELQMTSPRGRQRRVRFGKLRHAVDLEPALGRHLGFLGRLARQRRDQGHGSRAALACLVLGLLAAALGQGRGGRLRVALTTLLAVAAFEIGLWAVAVFLPGPLGAGLLAGAVGGASLVWLARPLSLSCRCWRPG